MDKKQVVTPSNEECEPVHKHPPANRLGSVHVTDGCETGRVMNLDDCKDKGDDLGEERNPLAHWRGRTVAPSERRWLFRTRRHTIAELDDHLLADIGLTRADANGIALQFGSRRN